MTETPTARDTFASTVGAFAATLGSAVGLGNIWKFPYLTGSNGGAAFVLTYLLAVALVGIPVMVVEHVIGRRMRLDAVQAYGKVVPRQRSWASSAGPGSSPPSSSWPSTRTSPAGSSPTSSSRSARSPPGGRSPRRPSARWRAGPGSRSCGSSRCWRSRRWIIAAGVSRGIERVTKALMPLLFALLLLCDLRALTLPGASAGVAYLFQPDLSKLSPAVLLAALGLAFFKLSLGMGTMTTYGSYLPDRVRIVPNAARVALADTAVSLLAGLAVFPAVFAFGGTPAGGPGLLFSTIPLIFSHMPMGGLFTAVFFVLTAIATIGAMVSLIEVPVAWLVEKAHLRRPAAARSPPARCSPSACRPRCRRARCWPT